MKNQSYGQVLGFPVTCVSYPSVESNKEPSERKDLVTRWINKLSKKASSYVQGIRKHVTSESKTSKTVDGNQKLSLTTTQTGRVERLFTQLFSVEQGEKLLKASRCYLSTTAGPIAGILFISTEKVAFHSERLLELKTPEGQIARVPYKVLIPLRRVKRAMPSENAYRQDQKFVQIVTMDDFEFWFTGFVSSLKSFGYLQHALSKSRCKKKSRTTTSFSKY